MLSNSKSVALAALLSMMAILLNACGGGSDSSSNSANDIAKDATAASGSRAHRASITKQQASLAKWSALTSLSINPGNASNLPGGKVALWSAGQLLAFTWPSGPGQTYSTVFDPATGSFTDRLVTETGHEMFCSGTSNLADGTILVTGGQNANNTSLFNAAANTWTAGAALNIARGYNANATLQDGSVLTLGGSFDGGAGGKGGEIYTPKTGWRKLSGVPVEPFTTGGSFDWTQTDYHMWLLPTGNGKVLHAGPSQNMNWIDPRGNGTVTSAGKRGNDQFSLSGTTVMYDTGKILKVGGADGYHDFESTGGAYVIDTNGGLAVRRLASPAYQRGMHNSVVLPNGQVVLVGGQTHQKGYTDANAVLVPELFDPESETFTPLPAMSAPRAYHSVALLLSDGRVMAAGGNLGCDASAGCPAHANMEILSPPYLFNADGSAATRPVITSAPARVGYGATITVAADSPIAAFAIVRLSSTTHNVNNDQRRLPLSFVAGANNSYQVSIPSNPGWALPGVWMLFAMNAQGVPSLAKDVLIDGTGAADIVNPGDQMSGAGSTTSVSVTATGASSFSANGLPPGLTINSATGQISGKPTVGGSYRVSLLATNSAGSVSTELMWSVQVPATSGNTGLYGRFYGNTGLGGTPVASGVVAPAVDTTAGTLPPLGADPALFSARYTGYLDPTVTGSTKLQTLSDDSVRVWVDGKLVIDNWASHTAATDTATVDLSVGRRVPVMIEYAQTGSTAILQFSWQPPGASAMTVVPQSRLIPWTPPTATNLAAGKPTQQSSTSGSATSSLAVDGNTDGNFGNGSVIHTDGGQAQAWWQVDLQQPSRIDLLQIWNRTDCCSSRLQNFTVFFSASDMSTRPLADLQADATVLKRTFGATSVTPSIGIPVAAVTRYIRIQALGAEPLNIAEVQAFGSTSFSVPTVSAVSAQQGTVGITASLAATGSEASDSALMWGATGLPAGMTINPDTGAITGVPATIGANTVTLYAVNASGLQASTGFGWQIQPNGSPVTSVAAPLVASGTTVSYAPVLASGLVAQFSWNFGDGSAATTASSSANVSHAFAASGTYSVVLTVLYGDGTSGSYRLLQAVGGSVGAAQAIASSNLLLEPRGTASARLWVVNPDNNSVSVFDSAGNQKLAEIAVGTAPRTLARASDGRIWVTNKDSATLSVIDPTSLAVVQTVAMPRGSQPYGIIFNPSATDGSAFVTLEAKGQLLRLQGINGATLNTLAVGDNPRHLAITAAADQLLVSRFITRPLPGEGTASVSTTDANGNPVGGEVLIVNPSTLALVKTVVLRHSDKPDLENQGRGIPNYVGAPAIAPDGRSAWVPSKLDNIKRGSLRDGNALNFQNSVRAVSSRIDLASLSEDTAARVDHDNTSLASAARYHPSGAYVFVALETSRQVAVLDAGNKRELFRIETGLAPQGLVFSADGKTLYVHNFMARTISVVDLTSLVGYGQLSATTTATLTTVATDLLPANVLKGKQLFYDARDTRLARDSYMSCASCHNDAGSDGRTWDFTNLGEGLRNTTALKGRAGIGQGFMHWSANFDEVQDFEGQIRTLSGGTGLMADADYNAGTRSQPLGDKKAGLSADLDALAAYLGSLAIFAPSPYRNADGTMTTAAQAGKAVFTTNCASCHGGAGFTTSADGAQLKNIGTVKASSGKRLSGTLAGIDIPTLRDAWATAPYLHDGSAATLSAAVSAHNNVSLSATDLANVVAYVQQIGSEEAPAAINLAQGKATTQSSDAFSGWSSRAVDGNTDGVYNNGSVSHTDTQAQSWWQVDLGQQSTLQAVKLWNRTDCCADRLTNFYVFVSATDMTGRTLAQLTADTTVARVQVASLNGASSVALALVAQGRYVRVQLSGTNYLSLAEVQVLGTPVNLAQGRAATQSSDINWASANRAVDGNTDGVFNNNSVTHTENAAQPWWQVDLGKLVALDAVQLWNRTDCCSDRLSSFYVLASPTDMTGKTLAQLLADPAVKQVPIASLNGSATLGLTMAGFNARYVRVQLGGTGYLSLAEVQVMGR